MTSRYHSLNCKNNSQYPCKTKNRVVVGKDHVDFIYQFAKDSNARAKAYNYENAWSIEDTCSNIIGPPTIFPKYGNFSKTLVVRNNSFDISISPWQKEPYSPPHASAYLQCIYCNKPHDENTIRLNYIDLEFHEAVYPIRVSIYEVYDPGCVTQILAQDSDKCWFELWTGRPRWLYTFRSRIFSPPLKFCDFKTKILRLMFIPSNCIDTSSHLDAVELIGTSKLILPKNPEKSLTELLKSINCKYPFEKVYNLTPLWSINHEITHLDILDLQKKFLEYCIICNRYYNHGLDIDKSDYKNKFVMHKQVHHSNYAYFIKDIELYWNESNEQPRSSFSALPDEIIKKILKDLDIRSLCRLSRVNKRLNNLTWDRFLITSLNLRNIRYNMHSICIDYIISNYIAPRCESLQQLDLTSSNIRIIFRKFSYFKDFLNICGKNLTHLRLRDCKFVDNSVLLQISKKCKNLKVLDLSWCNTKDDGITDEGFLYLENLEFLENLNLRCTFNITAETLCKILQKNSQMRDLNLSGLNIDQESILLDTVAIQIRNSCPDLEVINIGGNNITSLGIDALAECKNLRKLKISLMNPYGRYLPYNEFTIDKPSLRRLFSFCLLLEEVHLTHLMDDIVEDLTLCENLRLVHLDVPKEDNSFAILEQCPKLHTIYVYDGGKIRDIYAKDGGSHFVAQSKEKYPHLPIYEKDYFDYYFD